MVYQLITTDYFTVECMWIIQCFVIDYSLYREEKTKLSELINGSLEVCPFAEQEMGTSFRVSVKFYRGATEGFKEEKACHWLFHSYKWLPLPEPPLTAPNEGWGLLSSLRQDEVHTDLAQVTTVNS